MAHLDPANLPVPGNRPKARHGRNGSQQLPQNDPNAGTFGVCAGTPSDGKSREILAQSTSPLGMQLTPSMWLALRRLLKAHAAARRLNRPQWDFAVEIQALKETGLDNDDLRSLICQHLVEHGLETTRPRAKRRSFRRTPGLRLRVESCFVLSGRGLAISNALSAQANGAGNGNGEPTAAAVSILPVWDEHRRELRLGEMVLKRFRQPAKNQQTILAAFQEEGWPVRIDNPISGEHDENAQERLHNTIKRLNQQINPNIRFHTDGTAEGVLWSIEPRAH